MTGESKVVNITDEINNFQDELLSCWDVPFSLVSCSCSLMQTWIKMDSSARPPSSSCLMLQKLCQEFKNMLLQTLNCTKLKLRMHQGKTMFDSMDLKSTGIMNDEWLKFTRVFCILTICMYTREYQDSEFFSNQLQNIIEFFKNIHSLPAGLSFKLTNQVARFTQLANSSTLWTTLPCSHWLIVYN